MRSTTACYFFCGPLQPCSSVQSRLLQVSLQRAQASALQRDSSLVLQRAASERSAPHVQLHMLERSDPWQAWNPRKLYCTTAQCACMHSDLFAPALYTSEKAGPTPKTLAVASAKFEAPCPPRPSVPSCVVALAIALAVATWLHPGMPTVTFAVVPTVTVGAFAAAAAVTGTAAALYNGPWLQPISQRLHLLPELS